MLKTNKDRLVKQYVMGEITHPRLGRGYRTTFDGKAMMVPGGDSVKLNFRVGDIAYGWMADHLEPGVCIVNLGTPRQFTALNALGCIGNEARATTGDAKGAKGTVTGKHGWTKSFVDFQPDAMEKLAIGDKIQVTGWGVGLAIEGFDDVRVMSLSPLLLEKMGVEVEGSQLVVPVAKIVEGRMMGSGMGGGSGGIPDLGDFDIQSTCPELTGTYDLSGIRSGDIVGIKDMYSHYARGIRPRAVTIGVVSHGASFSSGHGPGVNPIISSPPGRLKLATYENANVGYYLGLRPEKDW
ncbi:MAG: DUF4438 domain-containing protein [Candidatus Bathyarchaeota archaeon]|nr:MAG: DUF4438 domain-containing protein [Candidatus Bathyarchaeota archaeon]